MGRQRNPPVCEIECVHADKVDAIRPIVTRLSGVGEVALVEREIPLVATARRAIREVHMLPDLLADSAVFVVRAATARWNPEHEEEPPLDYPRPGEVAG